MVTLRNTRCGGPWNGSWNGSQDDASAVSAVSAMFRSVGAASACGARGRASHNPPVVGSSPTRPTGSSCGHTPSAVSQLIAGRGADGCAQRGGDAPPVRLPQARGGLANRSHRAGRRSAPAQRPLTRAAVLRPIGQFHPVRGEGSPMNWANMLVGPAILTGWDWSSHGCWQRADPGRGCPHDSQSPRRTVRDLQYWQAQREGIPCRIWNGC